VRTILATAITVLLLGSSAVAQGTAGQAPETAAPSAPPAQPQGEPGAASPAAPAASTAKGCGATGSELAARDPMAPSACPSTSEAFKPSPEPPPANK
jgi:hypothetical protein